MWNENKAIRVGALYIWRVLCTDAPRAGQCRCFFGGALGVSGVGPFGACVLGGVAGVGALYILGVFNWGWS